MPKSISPCVFEGFPNNDWESATPPPLMEAVLSVRSVSRDGFFRIDILLKKEEKIRKDPRPWISFGTCYKEREKEAQRAAREIFDAFLLIGRTNRAIIGASPVAWAYGQAEAQLRDEFGSAQSIPEFYKIKLWIKDYCDGTDQTVRPENPSAEEWKQYLCRENWRAPMWLRIAASRHFEPDISAWDQLDEQNAFQRLDKKDTESLLEGICRLFWAAVHSTLENMARLESISVASHAAFERPEAGGGKAESAGSANQGSPSVTDLPAKVEQNVFSRIGCLWSVTFKGQQSYFPDQRGLRYLARLLEKPGQEFPALEVRASIQTPATPAPAATSQGTESRDHSLQERSDLKALRTYKDRVAEIDSEIVRAQCNNDVGRIQALTLEKEEILDLVRADTGLRGKPRHFQSERERARKSVSKAIENALAAIRCQCPALANHLRENVKTGNSFSYRQTSLQWDVSVR